MATTTNRNTILDSFGNVFVDGSFISIFISICKQLSFNFLRYVLFFRFC